MRRWRISRPWWHWEIWQPWMSLSGQFKLATLYLSFITISSPFIYIYISQKYVSIINRLSNYSLGWEFWRRATTSRALRTTLLRTMLWSDGQLYNAGPISALLRTRYRWIQLYICTKSLFFFTADLIVNSFHFYQYFIPFRVRLESRCTLVL